MVSAIFKAIRGCQVAARPSTRFTIKLLVVGTIGVYLTFAAIAVSSTHDRVGLGGAPLFYDFSVFHEAAVLADSGRAASAYDDRTMVAAVKNAFPGSRLRLPWNYPPTFQLMIMPLGVMPYLAAWLLWSGALYALYVFAARKLAVRFDQLWVFLLAPGVAVNLFFGQNGLLSIILMGGGVFLLRSNPVLGGVVLGMMAYKPQLALLIPLALICGREWRALASAIASQIMLALLAAIVLGTDSWVAFVNKIAKPDTIYNSSSSDWHGIPSIMVLGRSLGLNMQLSSAFHWAIAAIATGLAIWVWHHTTEARIRAAALGSATLLVTPYLRGYDLVLLLLPIAALLPYPSKNIWERIAIGIAWILPAILMFTAPDIQFGALIPLAMMILIFWHSGRPSEIFADANIGGNNRPQTGLIFKQEN